MRVIRPSRDRAGGIRCACAGIAQAWLRRYGATWVGASARRG